jgi:hypothetical protein
MCRCAYRELRLGAGLVEGPVDALPDLPERAAAVSAAAPAAPALTSSVAGWAQEVEALLKTGAGPDRRATRPHGDSSLTVTNRISR